MAEGIAAGAAGRAAPITAIIGTAGDRPDDTLRGIGRIAAERAQRVAIKQTLNYLRGRTPESVVGELLAGVKAGGGTVADVPVYDSEKEALRAELNGAAGHGPDGDGPMPPGSSCSCATRTATGSSSCSRASARARSTSPPS